MKHVMRLGSVGLVLLCLSAGQAAAQPTSEEPVNVWADTFDTANQMDVAVYTVPAGRQLIIDNVSMHGWVPAGEQVHAFNMNLPSVHVFVLSNQGTSGNRTHYAAGQSARLVVGPNQTIVFRVQRSNSGTSAYAFIALAGRLVK